MPVQTRIGFPRIWRRADFFNMKIRTIDYEYEEMQENGRSTGDTDLIAGKPNEVIQLVFKQFSTIEQFQLRSICHLFKEHIETIFRAKPSLVIRLSHFTRVHGSGQHRGDFDYVRYRQINPNYSRYKLDRPFCAALGFAEDQLKYLRNGGWLENNPVDVDIESDLFNEHTFNGLALFANVRQLTLRYECEFQKIQVVSDILKQFPLLEGLTVIFTQREWVTSYYFDSNRFSFSQFEDSQFSIEHANELYKIVDRCNLAQFKKLEIYCDEEVDTMMRGGDFDLPTSDRLKNLTHFMTNIAMSNQYDIWREMLASGSLTHFTLNQFYQENDTDEMFALYKNPLGASVTHLQLAIKMKFEGDGIRQVIELPKIRHHFPNVESLVVMNGNNLFDYNHVMIFTSDTFNSTWFEQLNQWTGLTQLKLFNCIPFEEFAIDKPFRGLALPSVKKLTIVAFDKRPVKFYPDLDYLKDIIKPNLEYGEYASLDEMLVEKYAKVRLMERFPRVVQLLLADYKNDRGYVLYSNGTFRFVQGFKREPQYDYYMARNTVDPE